MMWTRCDPLAAPGYDIGGDVQTSDSWETRWTRRMANGRWALITRYFYAAELDGDRWLECQTEYLACANPVDPGDEDWSDVAYKVMRRGVFTEADARRAAEDAAAPDDGEWYTHAPQWLGTLV